MRRRRFTAMIASGIAAATMVVVAPPASAATYEKRGFVRDSGCAGRVIDGRDIIGDSGRKLGRVELWYSSRNGGENCVITRSSVGRAEMLAALDVDRDRNRRWSAGDVTSSDYGKYSSYAGGAYRTGTDRRCVRFQGLIWTSSDSGSAPSFFAHCG